VLDHRASVVDLPAPLDPVIRTIPRSSLGQLAGDDRSPELV